MTVYFASISKQKSGDFLVVFPGLDGCFTEGKSLDEAKINAREALNGWLAAHCDLDIPTPTQSKLSKRKLHPIPVDLTVEFSIQLRRLRRFKKLTQAQAAKLLGISQQAYARLETPLKANPSLLTLQKVSEAIGGNIEFKLVG